MKICYVADMRSPTALSFVDHFPQRGDEVHVISTAPAARPSASIVSFRVEPLGYFGFDPNATPAGARSPLRRLQSALLSPRFSPINPALLTALRVGWLGGLEAMSKRTRLAAHLKEINPDIVH